MQLISKWYETLDRCLLLPEFHGSYAAAIRVESIAGILASGVRTRSEVCSKSLGSFSLCALVALDVTFATTTFSAQTHAPRILPCRIGSGKFGVYRIAMSQRGNAR